VTLSLERLLAPTEPVRIADAVTDARPQWIQADGWRVYAPTGVEGDGEPIETFTRGDGVRVSARVGDAGVTVPFSLDAAFANFASERWTGARDGGGLRRGQLAPRLLNAFYRVKRLIPRSLQLELRRQLMRRRGTPDFPAFPFEPSGVELLRFYARCAAVANGGQIRFRWFWPEGHAAALILTHDVESAEGLRLALELADLEEERGLRSSFNVVADWYPIDEGILRELRDRGFELGVHGVHHDRSMFASRESFMTQLPIVGATADRFGASGFRSPATHRVHEWLADLPLDYDCTVPFSDPYEALPGGCCIPWPFFIGDVVELPYTLPQDHTIFTLLRTRSVEPWLRQLERLEACNGLIQSVTHPDPGYLGDADKRALYVDFLDAIRERDGLWRALPREVARWWRRRDGGEGLPAVARAVDGSVELELLAV
jgi:hypothetical protein